MAIWLSIDDLQKNIFFKLNKGIVHQMSFSVPLFIQLLWIFGVLDVFLRKCVAVLLYSLVLMRYLINCEGFSENSLKIF